MARKMMREIDRALSDVLHFIEESKPVKERNSFKRRQLSFLGADVKRPCVPFDKGMARLEAKKQRRLALVQRRRDLRGSRQ